MPTHYNPGQRTWRRTSLPDAALLDDAVAAKTVRAMYAASAQLQAIGVRHALIGGLAVGAYGYQRATKDVDFLVGDEAFVHQASGLVTIRAGVPVAVMDVQVDLISIGPDESFLNDAFTRAIVSHHVPVVPLDVLVYLKLKASRRRDENDIREIMNMMPADEHYLVRAYLEKHAPELVSTFDAIEPE